MEHGAGSRRGQAIFFSYLSCVSWFERAVRGGGVGTPPSHSPLRLLLPCVFALDPLSTGPQDLQDWILSIPLSCLPPSFRTAETAVSRSCERAHISGFQSLEVFAPRFSRHWKTVAGVGLSGRSRKAKPDDPGGPRSAIAATEQHDPRLNPPVRLRSRQARRGNGLQLGKGIPEREAFALRYPV